MISLGGINYDPAAFGEPDKFDPDRFLRSEFGTRDGADDTGRRHDLVFGCGRVSLSIINVATSRL